MDKTFNQILIKNSSIEAQIVFKSHIKTISLNDFLSSYKISNFWKGKFFIKRLIKKIFKYQLFEEIKWDKNFWNRINIDLYKVQINLNYDIALFQNQIKDLISKKRFEDIISYKELLLKDKDLGNPLYIHSNCLKILGSKIKNDSYFILDGSRRMVAYTFLKKNPLILVININD